MFKIRRFDLPEKLRPLFSEAFEAPIWGMNHHDRKLLISTRNETAVEVSFSLFDLEAGVFKWRDIVFEEAWWIGVTHFFGNVAVFHTFENSQTFERKSIFGFDVDNSEVIWAYEGYNPVDTDGVNLVLTKVEGETIQYFNLNIKTGLITGLDEKGGESEKKREEISKYVLHPLHYVEGTSAFDSVASFLDLKDCGHISGAADYLEYSGKVVVSYFLKESGESQNRLTMFDNKGEVIHTEILNSGIEGLASDTFFIVDEALIFVRDKNELKGLLIGD